MITFILALMSKPTVTPLPVVLLLMDYWPLKRLNIKAVVEKLPLLIIAFLSADITYKSQELTAGVLPPSGRGLWDIPLILCHNIVFYLYKLVWPFNLSSHYAFPQTMSLANGMILAGVIGTIILLTILVISWRWTRALVVGWLFFFIAIFPTMGVIGFTNVIASDKYFYFPAIGLLMIAAWALSKLWAGSGGRPPLPARVVVILATVGLTAGLFVRNPRLSDHLADYQTARRAHAGLGGAREHPALQLGGGLLPRT